MKSILCYGDSLTWGSNPADGSRHAVENRWPTVLADGLGSGVSVFTDALRGRTTCFDDWSADCDRNGARTLPTALFAHAPLDLVIIMLGCNDMKPFICGNAAASARGIARLVSIIRGHNPETGSEAPDILIVAPPPLVETAHQEKSAIFKGVLGESRMMGSVFADLADDLNCGFFDAASVANASPLDGVHLDADNTRAIGRALVPVVKLMTGV